MSYMPFAMTKLYYKAHELCLMRNHTRNKAKQPPVVYFQKNIHRAMRFSAVL